MALRRKIWDAYIATIREIYNHRKYTLHDTSNIKNKRLCFITVAFNNDFLIEEQIRLIKKYITDTDYVHIVVDNSSDMRKRDAIKTVCSNACVPYFSLPFNWFSKIDKRGSYSHGLAMNLIYYKIIKKIKPEVFGFIDHDIFPIKPYSVLQKMDNQIFYGRLVDRSPDNHHRKLWYLWAGFCFFKFDEVKNLKMNYLPCQVDNVYLDTAGSNFLQLYSKYSLERINFTAPVIEKYFREGGEYHADLLHYIDLDWLHAINGSNWKKVKDKDDYLKGFLAQF